MNNINELLNLVNDMKDLANKINEVRNGAANDYIASIDTVYNELTTIYEEEVAITTDNNTNLIRERARAYKAKKEQEAKEWAEIGQQLIESAMNDSDTITGDKAVDDILMYLLEDTPESTNDDITIIREEETNDNFIADLEEFIKEAETLETKELLVQAEKLATVSDKNSFILNELLVNEDILAEFANKVITKEKQLEQVLYDIPTDCDKSIIELAMSAYDCSYKQAITKLAIALNINYSRDTPFKTTLEAIQHNRELLSNPREIVIRYPKLWNKMKKQAHMRKYFLFLLDLLQTQLEHKGISYKGESLLASASFGFIAKSLGKDTGSVRRNMNTIARYGMTNKLTDDIVMSLDTEHYEKIIALKNKGCRRTITSYELILWTNDVLQLANDKVIECRAMKQTHRAQTYQSMSVVGDGAVSNKADTLMDPTDRANINSLKKWARKKVLDKTGCGFFTKADWATRFNDSSKPASTIWAGEKKQQEYLAIVMAELNLISMNATKQLKQHMCSTKLNKVKHQCHVIIPQSVMNQL